MKTLRKVIIILILAVLIGWILFFVRKPKDESSLPDNGTESQTDQSRQEDSTDKEDEERQPLNVTLTYATMSLDQQMERWIFEYNNAHEDCQIEVKVYGEDDYETGLSRLNADIASGEAPDLIDLSDIDVDAYMNKGLFADLSAYIENKDDYVANLLRLYENDGKIYGVTPGFRLETLLGKKENFSDNAGWTVEAMEAMIRRMPEGTVVIDGLEPEGLLRTALFVAMDEYVNWEERTCSFDSEEFLGLLELAATMDGSFVDDTEESLGKGTLLLDRAYIGSISDYKSECDMFGGAEVTCVGYPSKEGGRSLIYPYLPIAISDSCANKEQAWQFVNSLLDEKFQSKYIVFNFPIRISTLESKFEDAMTLKEGWGNTAEDLPTEEQAEELYGMMDTAYGNNQIDENIWNIIEEEASYYFNNEKTAQEVAAIIQNRVELYLAEN